MPAVTKSFMPAFAAFMALSLTYTTVVARKEGAAVDGARTRWQQQKARGDHALYGGNLLEQMQH